MKKLLILILIWHIFYPIFAQYNIEIQNGDLLFVGLPSGHTADESNMGNAIVAATGDTSRINYIHVAILEVDESHNIWVIDATPEHGVDRHPFDTLLKEFTLPDGTPPIMDIKRLKHNQLSPQHIINAQNFCGREYDHYFLPNNEAKYCSELVRDVFLKRNGLHYFRRKPMNFKAADGTYPLYWQQHFAQLGQAIPQNIPGTNPQDLSKARCLISVGRLSIDQ